MSFDHVHDTVQLVLNLKILHVGSEFFHDTHLRNELSLSNSLFACQNRLPIRQNILKTQKTYKRNKYKFNRNKVKNIFLEKF